MESKAGFLFVAQFEGIWPSNTFYTWISWHILGDRPIPLVPLS